MLVVPIVLVVPAMLIVEAEGLQAIHVQNIRQRNFFKGVVCVLMDICKCQKKSKSYYPRAQGRPLAYRFLRSDRTGLAVVPRILLSQPCSVLSQVVGPFWHSMLFPDLLQNNTTVIECHP